MISEIIVRLVKPKRRQYPTSPKSKPREAGSAKHVEPDSHAADGPVNPSPKGTPESGPEERGREAVSEARDGGAAQSDHDDHLAATPRGVGGLAPEHGGQDLRAGEAALQQAGLGGDLGVRERVVERLELVEDVGLQGGDLEEVDDAAEEEDGELVLARDAHPGYGAAVAVAAAIPEVLARLARRDGVAAAVARPDMVALRVRVGDGVEAKLELSR